MEFAVVILNLIMMEYAKILLIIIVQNGIIKLINVEYVQIIIIKYNLSNTVVTKVFIILWLVVRLWLRMHLIIIVKNLILMLINVQSVMIIISLMELNVFNFLITLIIACNTTTFNIKIYVLNVIITLNYIMMFVVLIQSI